MLLLTLRLTHTHTHSLTHHWPSEATQGSVSCPRTHRHVDCMSWDLTNNLLTEIRTQSLLLKRKVFSTLFNVFQHCFPLWSKQEAGSRERELIKTDTIVKSNSSRQRHYSHWIYSNIFLVGVRCMFGWKRCSLQSFLPSERRTFTRMICWTPSCCRTPSSTPHEPQMKQDQNPFICPATGHLH